MASGGVNSNPLHVETGELSGGGIALETLLPHWCPPEWRAALHVAEDATLAGTIHGVPSVPQRVPSRSVTGFSQR